MFIAKLGIKLITAGLYLANIMSRVDTIEAENAKL
jgi:hypothetical protein